MVSRGIWNYISQTKILLNGYVIVVMKSDKWNKNVVMSPKKQTERGQPCLIPLMIPLCVLIVQQSWLNQCILVWTPLGIFTVGQKAKCLNIR